MPKKKRPRGRPATRVMPEMIPDSAANVVRAISQGPPKRDCQERRSDRRLTTYNLNNYVRYDETRLDLTRGSSYLAAGFAKRDGQFPADAEVPNMTNLASLFWSPFASEWRLNVIPTVDFEIRKIDDVEIEMALTTGVPSCPANWCAPER